MERHLAIRTRSFLVNGRSHATGGQRFAATPNLSATLQRRERSRRWLARKIGVSTSLMTFVVKGERTLSADKAMRAAAVLNEPVDYLFVATPQNNSDTEQEKAA